MRKRYVWLRWKRRPLCWVRLSHLWDGPHPVMVSGPAQLPPEERTYDVVGCQKQCLRCYLIRDVVLTPEDEMDAIQEATRLDLEEWNDDDARAERLAMLEGFSAQADEWFAKSDPAAYIEDSLDKIFPEEDKA